ncbi:MAG: aminopeptidase P family protein [Saprospiraceae bacterium]|nr:aminopeptidase P family protein [Saprospiraceae bacterium]
MFNKETYVNRRAQLQQQIGSGIILLPGNVESPINYLDNYYPFRQDSSFLYYIGIDQPHLAAIIDVDAGTTTLFGDDFSIDYIVWMGPQPTIAEIASKSGITDTKSYNAIIKTLQIAQSQNRHIHYLPPYRGENNIKLSEWLGIPVNEINNHASIELIKAVIAQRSIKTPEEIIEIEKAVNISGKMHLAAMRHARPGIKEAELRGIVEGVSMSNEGYPAYSVILTINGQTLHNHYYGNTLQSGQLVLGDFGSESPSRYAGDITRTFPVDKTFISQQKDIYNIVLKTEITSIEASRAGVRYLDVHLQAAKTIAEGLKDLGLMKGNVDDAVSEGAHALFFPHGLGHMMGLDVHDMEDLGENYIGYDDTVQRSTQFGLKSLRLAKKLHPGFVLTVEPGIYFIPELIDLWQKDNKYKDFINYDKLSAYRTFGGIRIEDNILITENGSKILGNPIPKTIEEVEAIRQSL